MLRNLDGVSLMPSIETVRDLVHSLIVALSVLQAALLAIEKLLSTNAARRLTGCDEGAAKK